MDAVELEWMLWVNALELVVIFVDYILAIGTVIASFYTPMHHIFHPNLMDLIYGMTAGWSLCMLARSISIIITFFTPEVLTSPELFLKQPLWPFGYLEMVRICSGVKCMSSLAVITVERTIATLRVSTYETQRNRKLLVFSIAYSWAIGVLATFVIFNSDTTTVASLCGIFGTAMSGFSLVVGLTSAFFLSLNH